jgi:hypothetical protein
MLADAFEITTTVFIGGYLLGGRSGSGKQGRGCCFYKLGGIAESSRNPTLRR